jgi:hypothetical protein
MVPLTSLVVPILVSAVIVFVASSIIHMLLGYHRADYKALPAETEVMEALRKFNLPTGDYMVPNAGSPAGMKDPAFLDKLNKGPVMTMTVMPSGPFSMGPTFVMWIVYCAVVSLFAGYIASRALAPAAPYLEVFRFVGTVAFVGYSLALWQFSIWYKRSWGTTIRSTIDGLIYGMLTAGTFGWLWPK